MRTHPHNPNIFLPLSQPHLQSRHSTDSPHSTGKTITVVSDSPFDSLSQGALQCVVVVFEAFELQKVFGPLAALASGGQVGDLDG